MNAESEYRSQFGGLWTDLSTAGSLTDARLQSGAITPVQAERLHRWIEDGFMILEKAVDQDLIDLVNADTEAAWAGSFSSLRVEHWIHGVTHFSPASPLLKSQPSKLLDLYAVSEATRRAIFSPTIVEFLGLLFQRHTLAFQSLSFERGSRQPMHQDCAYVGVSSPLEFAASWIALEDIQEGSGELEYFVGSHKLEYLFEGKFLNMPLDRPDTQRYEAWLQTACENAGLPRKRFVPKKGDALIWSASLAHGGSKVKNPALFRKSIVTHYCPADLEPRYFQYNRTPGRIPYSENAFYSHDLLT